MQHLPTAATVARWSVYALFTLVPVFFIPLAWVSVQQSKTLLVVLAVTVAFLAWVAASLNAGSFRFPRSTLLIATILIPVAYFISAIAAGSSLESFAGDGRGQDTVVSFILLYLAFFTSAVILSGSGVNPALRFFILGSSIVLAIQYIHLFAPSFTFAGALPVPASSIVGSWHDLGILLTLLVFVSLFLQRTTVLEGYWKTASLGVALASFILLVIINFSDTWLGMFCLSAFAAFWVYKNQARGGPKTLDTQLSFVIWIVLVLVSVSMYFFGDNVRNVLPQSLQITQVEVRPSWQGTFAIGREVFAEPTQIFFGSGPNTFSREWGVHKPLPVNETEFWNTEFYYGVGFIPTSLVTTGIMGLIAWGAVSLALLWGSYRLYRESSKTTPLSIALMGSALYLTLFHILYVPGPAILLITFLIFGVLVAERVFAGEVRESVISTSFDSWKGKTSAIFFIVSGFLVFLGSVQMTRAVVSDVLINRAVAQYSETGNVDKATRSLSLSLKVLPNNDRAHRAGVELGILHLSELASRDVTNETARAQLQATLAATIQHGLTAVSIESEDYQNWFTLARLYGELAGAGVEGAETSARDAYKEAKAKNPSSPLPYLGEAQLDLVRGNDTAAQKSLEEALVRKPNLAAAHYLLSQIYARRSDLAKALAYANASVEAAPADPLGWYNLGTILYAGEDYSNATLAFEQALALQNNYANALFLLGLSYQRLDRIDDSLRALKTVQALNPGNAELESLIAQLESNEDTAPNPEPEETATLEGDEDIAPNVETDEDTTATSSPQ